MILLTINLFLVFLRRCYFILFSILFHMHHFIRMEKHVSINNARIKYRTIDRIQNVWIKKKTNCFFLYIRLTNINWNWVTLIATKQIYDAIFRLNFYFLTNCEVEKTDSFYSDKRIDENIFFSKSKFVNCLSKWNLKKNCARNLNNSNGRLLVQRTIVIGSIGFFVSRTNEPPDWLLLVRQTVTPKRQMILVLFWKFFACLEFISFH